MLLKFCIIAPIKHLFCDVSPFRLVGKIKRGVEVTGRRGRRRRKLLDDLRERRGYSHLKEEAPDRTVWGAALGEALDLS